MRWKGDSEGSGFEIVSSHCSRAEQMIDCLA